MGIGGRRLAEVSIIITVLTVGFTSFNFASASEETEILVTMVGSSVFNLDEENRFVRATVDVINYDPGDGYYYMAVIQPGTGKIIKQSEILISERDNDMWGAEIAGMIDEEKLIQNDKIVQGDYQIKISTQFGTATGSTIFSIIKPSETPQPKVQETKEEQVQTTQETEVVEFPGVISESDESDPEISQGEDSNPLKIPEWVKNIALWYGQGTVSEDEFINAIKFLIEQGIVKV